MCWQPIWQPTRSPIWQHAHQPPVGPAYYRCHKLLLKPLSLCQRVCVWLKRSVRQKQSEKNTNQNNSRKKMNRHWNIKKKDESKGVFFNQHVRVYSLLRGVSIIRHVFTYIKPFNKHTSGTQWEENSNKNQDVWNNSSSVCVCVALTHHARVCACEFVLQHKHTSYLQLFQKHSALALTPV